MLNSNNTLYFGDAIIDQVNFETVTPNSPINATVGENVRICECNISTETLTHFQKALILIVLPLISCTGILDNMSNITIYFRYKDSASRYLAFLSVSDFCVCTMGILVMFSDTLRSYNYAIDQLFTILLPYLSPLSSIFQMFSVYITVFAACDCFASVSRNFSQMKGWYCKTEVANRIVFYIFIFVISYNIITFKELEAIVCFHPQYQHDVYELCPTALRINEDYTTIYRGYMYALIYAFLPFVLLCMLTFGILFSINQKKAPTCNTVIANTKSINFCTTETGNFQSKNEENDENGSAPIVLIMVVALFLLCNIIPLAANICELMPGLLEESQMHLMGDIGNILVIFNATANFFIYLRFSSAYAKDFKYLMCNSTVISKCQTQSNNKFCLETENV